MSQQKATGWKVPLLFCAVIYVVKTTELGRKPRGRCGNWVFWGFTKRITL